jgi:hypothetical protein
MIDTLRRLNEATALEVDACLQGSTAQTRWMWKHQCKANEAHVGMKMKASKSMQRRRDDWSPMTHEANWQATMRIETK